MYYIYIRFLRKKLCLDLYSSVHQIQLSKIVFFFFYNLIGTSLGSEDAVVTKMDIVLAITELQSS